VTRFLLIRHADHDAIGRYLAGQRAGLPLNASGRAQVAALVAALRTVPLTAVVSSPLERTRETAEPIARDHGLEVIVMPDLVEFDVGDWTGRPFSALDRETTWRQFNDYRSITRAPGGETMLEVQARAMRALLELRARYPSGTIATVFHGDVIRSVVMHLLGMPIDFLHRLEISPGRITVADVGDQEIRVLRVNADTVPAP
jgi:broad specificity phosphatase PhoE